MLLINRAPAPLFPERWHGQTDMPADVAGVPLIMPAVNRKLLMQAMHLAIGVTLTLKVIKDGWLTH